VDALDPSDVLRALLENSLAEAEAGHCAAIAVEVSDDAIRVCDDGRGLPVHPHPTSGRSLLEVIMTGPRRGPKNTLARVNASALWLEVEVHRDGQLWFQRYEYARPATPLHRKGSAIRRGTTLTVAPARGETPGFEALRDQIRAATAEARASGLKVRLRDHRVAREETIVA